MASKLIINIHSFIDIITNSSTEIFVCDTDKTLEVVQNLVYEMEKKYPNEYGHRLHVDYADDDDLDFMFGYMNEKVAVKFLEAKGYKLIKPEKNTKRFISISEERGGMHPKLFNFIKENFNVVHYTTEA